MDCQIIRLDTIFMSICFFSSSFKKNFFLAHFLYLFYLNLLFSISYNMLKVLYQLYTYSLVFLVVLVYNVVLNHTYLDQMVHIQHHNIFQTDFAQKNEKFKLEIIKKIINFFKLPLHFHCYDFLVEVLENFYLKDQFDLLLHLNLNFLMFAFHLNDEVPIYKKKQLKKISKKFTSKFYLGSGTGGKVPECIGNVPCIGKVPCIDILASVFIFPICCKFG